MSSLQTVDCPIIDIDAATTTAKILGGTLVRQSEFQWHGQKSPCEYAIKVPGTTWEIGLIKDATTKTYGLKFDNWSTCGQVLEQWLGGKDGKRFKKEYTIQTAINVARKKGYTAQRIEAKGKTRLVLTGM